MTGEELKKKIQEHGFTQTMIAQAMGVTSQNVQSLLRSNDVKTGTVEAIARIMGVSVSALYNEYPILSVDDYARIKLLEVENAHLREHVESLSRLIAEKDLRLADRETLMKKIKDIL